MILTSDEPKEQVWWWKWRTVDRAVLKKRTEKINMEGRQIYVLIIN